MANCTIEQCEKKQHGRGLCSKHYIRKYRTPQRNAYYQMRSRCLDPGHLRYKDYGGRGITICARWLESYDNFIEDMGERPKGMTLDRIDNDGNYEPSNCRWATYGEQNLNKRSYSNNKSGTVGVSFHQASKMWMAHIRIKGVGKSWYFKTKEEAVKTRLRAELEREVKSK